jgi:transposase
VLYFSSQFKREENMANKPMAMNKLRTVIRLYVEGKGKKFIASYLDISKNTVTKYIRLFTSTKLSLEQVKGMSDRELYKLFQMPSEKDIPLRLKELIAFLPRVRKELKRPGVTRLLMWEEYISTHQGGYGKTQFCKHYNKWRGVTKPSMRIDHKAGDKLYIDYTGKKLQVIDKNSGECIDTEVFVSILGASQLIYVEATYTQRKEDFVTSVENSLHYYNGVPLAIVPDNLKSAVTKSHRYEPTLNETFKDFAEYYGTTILPARVYKPKDKALVEGAVKIVYTSIYASLRDQEFFSIESLNEAIWRELEKLNNRKLNNRPYSRRELFNDIERDILKPLPEERYQIKESAWATVMKIGHVVLQKDKHYYSVPYRFIGKKVKVIWSSKQVWIYSHYECIASHSRTKSPYNYTTLEDHLASSHKFIAKWNPEYFLSWARGIDPNVEQLIGDILIRKKYPEQAYRSCVGVLALAKKVGDKRLSAACKRALEYGVCNYKTVQNILEKGLDSEVYEEEQENKIPDHSNIRGKKYYS